MSKKNKKKQWKAVEFTAILGETRPVAAAWADEVDIDERDIQLAAARKQVLPTAPRSARGSDDERVPNAPPYVAYITNIPFELVEDDIEEFFGDLQIESIRLPRHESTGKLRGYGYVEFTERNGLIEALRISDTSMKGRRIRIDVSENNDRDRGYGRSDRMGRDRMGMGLGRDRDDDPDRTSGDWRSAPRMEPSGEDRDRMSRSSGRRDFGGGGFRDGDQDGRERDGFGAPRDTEIREGGWREGMGSGTSGPDRFGDRDRDRDSYRSRGFGDRDRDGFDRDRGSRFGERDGYGDRPRFREREGYGDRPRYGDRDNEDDKDRYPRRDDAPPSDASEPRSRPKLQLQPRTRPVENPPPAPEVVKEKEKEKEPPPPPVPRASIFGAAKPVDTTAREREIEERLAREKDRAPRRDEEKNSENPRSKDTSEHSDDQSKKVEPAPPPKENAWSRRPRLEPSSNNGDASGNNQSSDRRTASPGSAENDKCSQANSDSSKENASQGDSSDRSRSQVISREQSVRTVSSEGKRSQSGDSKGSQDNWDEPNRDQDTGRSKDDSSNSDRIKRRDHSSDEQPRLPKYEEKPIPNFVASNKYSFLNEDDDQDGASDGERN